MASERRKQRRDVVGMDHSVSETVKLQAREAVVKTPGYTKLHIPSLGATTPRQFPKASSGQHASDLG